MARNRRAGHGIQSCRETLERLTARIGFAQVQETIFDEGTESECRTYALILNPAKDRCGIQHHASGMSGRFDLENLVEADLVMLRNALVKALERK